MSRLKPLSIATLPSLLTVGLLAAGLLGIRPTHLQAERGGGPSPGSSPGSSPHGSVMPTPRPPAPPEWRQGIRYRIEARLDEEAEVLRARGEVRYRNESPDTLRDFYFHLYLNAFRPNSAWARYDLERGVRTFQDLGPEEHAFERVRGMTVNGQPARTSYPYAPDSTILRVHLPRPLPPGDALTLAYDWEARPSVVPRRQGRRGRHYDFAQWYPRVVAYDLEGWADHPLYRAGEFYGDFATYDVTFELRDDQVVGSTGVPLEGDPGWETAAAPGTGPIDYARDFYGSVGGPPCITGPSGETICGIAPHRDGPPRAQPLGLLESRAPAGWKQVRFYARDVHHFAWSTSPDYIYEHGQEGGTPIHVLYQPGDEESWGGGIAVERTAVALEWLRHVFGPYLYPQITNLHRIEGGGTEFPMVIMDGSASLGLIIHEAGHIYAMGMLANNEWREGWLDEGLTSFQTAWFNERRGAGRRAWLGSEMRVLSLDLQGISEPVVQPSEHYTDMGVYSTMIYTKGSLIFRMLRDMVGDEAFLEVLRTYFRRYAPGHVDQEAFQSVAEEVLRMDLDWFFGQWLHATGVVDYGVEDVETGEGEAGAFQTEVRIRRHGEMVMPVPVRLWGPEGRHGGQVVDTVLPGSGRILSHRISTPWRPEALTLDPEGTILDWNGLNDHWPRWGFRSPARDRRLDRPFRPQVSARDQLLCLLFPLVWYNDAGGAVLGLQRRGNYMGFMQRTLVRFGLPAFEVGDKGGEAETTDYGSFYFRQENPIVLHEPAFGLSMEGFVGEGRGFLSSTLRKDLSTRPFSGPRRAVRTFASVATVYDSTYLRPGRWEMVDHTTVEGGLGASGSVQTRETSIALDLSGAGGLTTRGHRYVRGSITATLDRDLPRDASLRLRAFAGAVTGDESGDGEDWGGDHVPLERRFFLAGGGPWETLGNPFFRSAGAPLAERGFVPGGGGVRGVDPSRWVDRVLSLNADLISGSVALGPLDLRGRAFGDVAYTPGLETVKREGDVISIQEHTLVMDSGVGFDVGWRRSPIRLRVDFPLVVNDPALALEKREETLGFRGVISVEGYY